MKIIVSGSIALDRIMVYQGLFKDVIKPDKLHLLSLSLLLDELHETKGGVAANIAYSLGLLGEQPILLGSVGQNARPYMNDLAQLGVNTDWLHFSVKPTASFSVITDKANCQIGGFYSGAMADAGSLTLLPWKDDSEVLVVVAPHDPEQMAAQVDECLQWGKRLFYDVGQQVNNIKADDIRAGIEAAELLIVNDYEMAIIADKTGWSETEVINRLKVCVVTLGEHGCRVYTKGKVSEVGVVKDLAVVDPTGAGDAFRAGFLYGYVRDWLPIHCAQLGAVVASFALEKPGTQEHTFTRSNLAERYQKTFNSPLPE